METLNDSLKDEARKLMKFDALAEAEVVTGRSYKEDKATTFIGMVMMQENNAELNKIMDLLEDTHFRSFYSSFQKISENIGFVKIYSENIPDPEQQNILEVWWHSNNGILMKSESYWGKNGNLGTINSLNIYYNWKPNDIKTAHKFTSSGGFFDLQNPSERLPFRCEDLDLVWESNFDGRTGLRLHIEALEKNGQFLKKWKKQPFIWLLNYMDVKDKGYDYNAINARKIRKFPKEIQNAILFQE